MDRRLLANVDRRLLSEMDHAEGVQLVKVPVSDAVWSTWRRYCDGLGLPMGRGLAFLLQHELAAVVDEDFGELVDKLAERASDIAATGAELAAAKKELREKERNLAVRAAEVAAAENELARREAAVGSREAKAAQGPAPAPPRTRKPPKIGRNDPCWCGSRKEFKVCHLGSTP